MIIASFCLFADDNVKGFRAAVTVITVLGSLYGSRQQRVRRPSYNRFDGRTTNVMQQYRILIAASVARTGNIVSVIQA